MIRVAPGGPAIAIANNQSEFAVLDGGLIRFYSSSSGELLGEIEVALGEGELRYVGVDRLVAVIRTGDHTWVALIRRSDRTVLSRAELTGPQRLVVGFSERIILLDPAAERPRLGSIAADSIGFEPLQVRTPLRFACVTPEEEFLLAARDEILRWDPVHKRAVARLHLPIDPQITRAGFATRHRQLWMVRGDRLRVFRFSDGRPQGELRAGGKIEEVTFEPASSRIVLLVQAGEQRLLEQIDLGTSEVLPLGPPQHQSIAVIESTPPWLVGVDAGGEPVRTPLQPPSILGEFNVEQPKRPPGDGAMRGDWRSRLRPKRAGEAAAHEPTEEAHDPDTDAPPPEGEEEEADAPAAQPAPRAASIARSERGAALVPERGRTAPPRVERALPPAAALDRLSALVGPLGRHPMAELARYARSVLGGETQRPPSVSASRVLHVERRFGLSKSAATLCQLLYGVRLLGDPDGGIAPVDALRAFAPKSDSEVEATWEEVVAAGDLGRRRLCELERGRLRLSETVARFLDGQPTRLRILDGEAELDEPPEPAYYRLDGTDLEALGASLAGALGAPVALLAGGDLRAQLVEARLHGAVPLVDTPLFEPWLLQEDWVIVVLRRRAQPLVDALTPLDLDPAPAEPRP